MKNLITNRLASLASAKYQERYIKHASKYEYALPEEMLDSVRGTVFTIMTNPTIRKSFSDIQLAALQQFDEVAGKLNAELPWNASTTAAMILECPEWKHLREAAASCLLAFSLNISDWESEI